MIDTRKNFIQKIMILASVILLGTFMLPQKSMAQINPGDADWTPATALPDTCNPYVYNGMKANAIMNSQRSTQLAQSLVTRPDPAANMVCLGQQLMAAAQSIGSIFTDNPQFAGSCAIGSMSGTTIDAIMNTMSMVVSAYNLGGGTLTSAFDSATEALAAYATSTASAAIGSAIGSALGSLLGSCWGGIAGGLISGYINDQFGVNGCETMDTVWEGVALRNVDGGFFKSARELQLSDPRTAVAGIPFTTVLASNLFGQAVGSDTNYLTAGGAYAPVNSGSREFLISTPLSEALTMGGGMGGNGCNWVRPGGLGTICNAGCTTTGGTPAVPCIPN